MQCMKVQACQWLQAEPQQDQQGLSQDLQKHVTRYPTANLILCGGRKGHPSLHKLLGFIHGSSSCATSACIPWKSACSVPRQLTIIYMKHEEQLHFLRTLLVFLVVRLLQDRTLPSGPAAAPGLSKCFLRVHNPLTNLLICTVWWYAYYENGIDGCKQLAECFNLSFWLACTKSGTCRTPILSRFALFAGWFRSSLLWETKREGRKALSLKTSRTGWIQRHFLPYVC